jgi:hypothetical protein
LPDVESRIGNRIAVGCEHSHRQQVRRIL